MNPPTYDHHHILSIHLAFTQTFSHILASPETLAVNVARYPALLKHYGIEDEEPSAEPTPKQSPTPTSSVDDVRTNDGKIQKEHTEKHEKAKPPQPKPGPRKKLRLTELERLVRTSEKQTRTRRARKSNTNGVSKPSPPAERRSHAASLAAGRKATGGPRGRLLKKMSATSLQKRHPGVGKAAEVELYVNHYHELRRRRRRLRMGSVELDVEQLLLACERAKRRDWSAWKGLKGTIVLGRNLRLGRRDLWRGIREDGKFGAGVQ